jgi:hypothetical protein
VFIDAPKFSAIEKRPSAWIKALYKSTSPKPPGLSEAK